MHKNILHMAGQLGLDPPTMILCEGGVDAELGKALENSEAVANCFNCSICTSTIAFIVYCSAHIPTTERSQVQDKLDARIKEMRLSRSVKDSSFEPLDSLFLYILVPDLPKGYFSYAVYLPTSWCSGETVGNHFPFVLIRPLSPRGMGYAYTFAHMYSLKLQKNE